MQQYNKWVYAGCFLGLISAFIVGLIFQVYLSGFESKMSELYLKIGIMGMAVVVLTYMVFWMAKNSKNLKSDIEKDIGVALSTGSVIPLVVMGYLAILREGFETVLFMGAIYGNDMHSGVFYGAAIGLVIALVVTIALFKGMKRLPIKLFFQITGGLILVISAGLLSNMIGIMQDIQILPVIKGQLFDLSWFMIDSSDVGIFFKALFGYTHSPTLTQVVSYFGYFSLILLLVSGERKFPYLKRGVAHA